MPRRSHTAGLSPRAASPTCPVQSPCAPASRRPGRRPGSPTRWSSRRTDGRQRARPPGRSAPRSALATRPAGAMERPSGPARRHPARPQAATRRRRQATVACRPGQGVGPARAVVLARRARVMAARTPAVALTRQARVAAWRPTRAAVLAPRASVLAARRPTRAVVLTRRAPRALTGGTPAEMGWPAPHLPTQTRPPEPASRPADLMGATPHPVSMGGPRARPARRRPSRPHTRRASPPARSRRLPASRGSPPWRPTYHFGAGRGSLGAVPP